MTPEQERQCGEDLHVRRVDRSCGTCKHFVRIYEDCHCENPKIFELPSHYWQFSGLDEGYVCDLFEKADEKTIRDRG